MNIRELLEFAPDEKPLVPKLVHKATGKEVEIGDEVTDFRGEKGVVTGMRPPHKPASQGHIEVDGHECYASVFDCEWINRTDRG